MRSALAGFVAGVLAAGAASVVHVSRGTGRWTSPVDSRDFDVQTFELIVGPWYLELVWGRW